MSLLAFCQVVPHEVHARKCHYLGNGPERCSWDAAYDLVSVNDWLPGMRIAICMEHARYAVLQGATPPLD